MSDAPEIQVVPHEDGSWTVVDTDDSSSGTETYNSRKEAIAAAREVNGRKEVTATDSDGNVVGSGWVGGAKRVVLLQVDGTLHGELDSAPSDTAGPAQLVSLIPATETHGAVTVNG